MPTLNRYRNKCRKDGICYGCGNYIGLGKYKRCASCREKDNKRKTKKYALFCLEQQGVCLCCKSTIKVDTYRKCPICREKDKIRSSNAYYRNKSNAVLLNN